MSGRTAALPAAAVAAATLLCLAACGDGTNAAPAAPAEVRVTPPIAPDADTDGFVNVTAAAGLDFVFRLGDGHMDNILESIGTGASWIDADGDGWLDLYLVSSAWREGVSEGAPPTPAPTNRLFRNRGDGSFEDVTATSGLGDAGFGFSAAVADYDGDGDSDLYLCNLGPNRLFRNRGDGSFEDVTQAAGVNDPSCTIAAAFFDADDDGRLDLYLANYLEFDPDYEAHYSPDVFPGPLAYAAQADRFFRQSDGGRFEDATESAGFAVQAGRSMGLSVFDADGDRKPELFLANDATANFLFRNQGGRFAENGLSAGVAFGVNGEATGAMAGAVGDYDGDGLPDLSVTDTAYGSLYRNLGGGMFEDRVAPAGVAAVSAQRVSWGGGFFDFDLDGDLDLYLGNGDLHHPTGRADLLLENRDGAFADVSERSGACFRAELLTRGALIGDPDNDGDLNLVLTTIRDRVVLLENRAAAGRHWIGFELQGAGGNRDAWGAVVDVAAGGASRRQQRQPRCGYLTQGDARLHFGLGEATAIDGVTVTWPDGAVESFPGLEIDRYHRLEQGKGEK